MSAFDPKRASLWKSDCQLIASTTADMGHARASGKINHADVEKIISIIEQAVSGGSYLAFAPQFVVTATR